MYSPVNLGKTVLQKQTSVHLRSHATLIGRKRKVQKIFFFFKSRNPKYSTRDPYGYLNQFSYFTFVDWTQSTQTKPIWNIPPKLHQIHTVLNIYNIYVYLKRDHVRDTKGDSSILCVVYKVAQKRGSERARVGRTHNNKEKRKTRRTTTTTSFVLTRERAPIVLLDNTRFD